MPLNQYDSRLKILTLVPRLGPMGGGFAAGAAAFSPCGGAAGGEEPSVEASTRNLVEGRAAMEGFNGEVLCILTNVALREEEMEELEAVGSDRSVAEAIAVAEGMPSTSPYSAPS